MFIVAYWKPPNLKPSLFSFLRSWFISFFLWQIMGFLLLQRFLSNCSWTVVLKKKILNRNEAAAAGPRSLVERARAWLTFDRFASPDRIGVTSGGLSTRDEEGSGIPFSLRPRLIIPRQTKAQNILVSIEEGSKGDPGRPWLTSREVIRFPKA